VNPKHSKLLKKARALSLSERSLDACVAYRDFLKREPRHADAWAELAIQLLNLGRHEQAREACEASLAIDPAQRSARLNLGLALMLLGRSSAAESLFRSVLGTDPNQMDARLFLAVCLLEKQDLDDAWIVLAGGRHHENSELEPQHAALWAQLGVALFERRKFETAEEACRASLRLDPHNLTAQAYLGSIRMELGDLEQATGLFQRLAAKHPGDERVQLLLITCLARRGDPDPVRREITKALNHSPTSFLVHKSVMGPYYSLGCWADYRAEIQRFRKVDPTLAYLDFEQSFMDILFGDMRQGWKRFEARLKIPVEFRPQRTFEQPAWTGESFAGKTLLLWPEQGLGDTLMTLRYLPLVKALGGRVILETQPELKDVAATCDGADDVISTDELLPSFDLQASLLSLPYLFRTELASIPSVIPYLRVPEQVPHRPSLQEALAQAMGTRRIGLVWAGGPGHARDSERSMTAASLAPLAVLPGVTWYSLQVGREEVPPLPNLVPLAPLLGSFSDTAYALKGMDLVITVDTSVAHLAGAMGIPTLLLLAFQPDYRWMLDRDDSPWYPTLRLYRQPAYGDWAAVIRRLVQDLTQGS
jgi:tetratricopeptide (TPR) repeat protein